jgi:hypothetical protein
MASRQSRPGPAASQTTTPSVGLSPVIPCLVRCHRQQQWPRVPGEYCCLQRQRTHIRFVARRDNMSTPSELLRPTRFAVHRRVRATCPFPCHMAMPGGAPIADCLVTELSLAWHAIRRRSSSAPTLSALRICALSANDQPFPERTANISKHAAQTSPWIRDALLLTRSSIAVRLFCQVTTHGPEGGPHRRRICQTCASLRP